LRSDEEGFDLVEHRVLLERVLEQLPDRERTIVELRFFHDKTQSEIADAVGISQMHVSRLLTRVLGQLRDSLKTLDA
jgi:RNA polymerase sigma-B factor